MATNTTFLNMRKADNGDLVSVLNDIDAAFTTLDSLFDPAALSAAQSPRVVMRETVHNPTYVGAANTIDLRPVWNAPGVTLRGLFIDATHTGAGASSRVIEVRRSGNPIWDVDITTQNAVNGLSLQGGAAGNAVKLVAIGTDPAVNIQLQPKGTGAIVLGASTSILGANPLALYNAVNDAFVTLANSGASGSSLLSINAGVSVTGAVTAAAGGSPSFVVAPGSNQGFLARGLTAGYNAFYTSLAGDTVDRLIIGSDGVFNFSGGSGSSDTSLSRVAAGVLGTPGAFQLSKLFLTAAASRIVAGATSLSLRNSADTLDNFLMTDAGAITVRSTISGATTITATTFSGALSGNASTATALQTARAINGVNFDGTAPITVTAAAGTLTGNTLAAGVTASSLTSVGTLTSLTTSGAITQTATASKLIPGATSFSHRNNADNADNLLITDAGIITTRNNLGLGRTPEAWPVGNILHAVGLAGSINSSTVNADTAMNANVSWDGSNTRSIVAGQGGRVILAATGTIALQVHGSVAAGAIQNAWVGLTVTNAGDLQPTAGTTGMTAGFVYIPAASGAPTGAPSGITATLAPLYYDTANKKLWVRDQPTGTWKGTVMS